jgi:tRNA (pseudouridine54-N1)-methyltransferase
MSKETERHVEPGITVRTLSFEKLVQHLAENHQLYITDKKGDSIRELTLAENPCFLLTDHIPMPKKCFNILKRLGAQKISLGPKMLFASQCIVLINNQLDLGV